MIDLHYQQLSEKGEPLIAVHGLFGSLENLGVITRLLADTYQVYAVDLRNHGRSPHRDEMTHAVSADDIVRLMDKLGLKSAHLFGHSLGGKAVMQVALSYPERVRKVVVGDITPAASRGNHDNVFNGIFAVDLDVVDSRRDVDKVLAEHIQEPAVRSFILKNLVRDEDNNYSWKANMQALREQYEHILAPVAYIAPFTGPVLFIKGGDSDYLTPADTPEVLARFPSASVKVIEGTGHWLHAEKPAVFVRLMLNFLQGS